MKLFGLFAILLVAVFSVAYAEDCSMDSLSQESVDELEKYDKELYKDPICLGEAPLPAWCNFMGLSEDCSACYMTCDGANQYLADTLLEIEEWGALTSNFAETFINFCPDAEVGFMEDCPTTAV